LISQLEKEITFRFLKARKNDGFLNIYFNLFIYWNWAWGSSFDYCNVSYEWF
tara:strand:+ start:441 stop:596 length:156 start_codon:yes stop_codon:yes gene_type:complete